MRGEREIKTPWLRVGPLRLAPSASYTLTPIGGERTLLSGWGVGRISGTVHARWSDRLQGRRLVGGGGMLKLAKPGMLLESVSVDVWRRTSEDLGVHFEATGGWRRSPASRIAVRWTAGVKSRGYLTGFDEAAGVYGGLGLRLRF